MSVCLEREGSENRTYSGRHPLPVARHAEQGADALSEGDDLKQAAEAVKENPRWRHRWQGSSFFGVV